MKLSSIVRTISVGLCTLAGVLALSACTTDDPTNSPAGPGVENPAAAAPNSVVPGVGGQVSNGGGASGGGPGGSLGN